MNYVLGFIFSLDGKNVLLMRKNRPDWQKGKLNGIGGKIDGDEDPLSAMIRECAEETTADVPWTQFGELLFNSNPGTGVKLFYGFYDGSLSDIRAETDEQLEIHPVSALPSDVIPNLHWLIPMAVKDTVFYSVLEV